MYMFCTYIIAYSDIQVNGVSIVAFAEAFRVRMPAKPLERLICIQNRYKQSKLSGFVPRGENNPLAFHVKLDEARKFALNYPFSAPLGKSRGTWKVTAVNPLPVGLKVFAILHHVSFLVHLKKFLRVYRSHVASVV